MLAVEIVRAAWRIHRCATAEAEDGENPATQASVDRARASAHNSMRRLLNDLRQFQSDRWLRAEVLRDGFNEAYIGIADAHRVIKGLVDDSRLKSKTIQTQLAAQVGLSPANVEQASRPVNPPPAPTNRPNRSARPPRWRRRSGGVDPSRISAAGVAQDFLAQPPPPFSPFPATPLAPAIPASNTSAVAEPPPLPF